MPACYGNAWTTSSTSSSTGILWMGSGGGGTATTTSVAASDCYMWVGGQQYVDTQTQSAYLQHAQMLELHQQHMQAVGQMQQYNAEAQRANHERQQREVQLREAEQQRTQPARDRAKELLLMHLTPAQKETFEKNQWFIVEGGRSKQRYRIHTHHVIANIDVMAGDKVKHRLCAHLNASCGAPMNDHILAQKLMLEAAEDDFLKVANRHAA